MLRVLQTFDGHNINDGTNYRAFLLNPSNTPPAAPVFAAMTNADAEDTGLYTVDVHVAAVGIQILDYANRQTLMAQLQKWFKRGTRGDLVVEYLDEGLDYYRPCRVVNLVQDPDHPLRFIATLQTGWTTWRAVTPDTYEWNLTGTGGNYELTLNGDDETPLSASFTLNSAPANGYQYQQLYQLPNKLLVALGYGPWCIELDTAALIADNSNKCQINGAINNSVTTIPYDTVTGTLPSIGSGYIDSEQIKWTGKTGTTSGNLTGVTRGIGGTTAASHADNAEIKLSYMLANCNDLRVWLNGAETRRWIVNPNTSSTKVWINMTLSAGQNLTLATAITDTDDFDYLIFQKTQNTYNAIAAMPYSGIVMHGTEWFKYQKYNSYTLRVVERGLLQTTKQTHAVDDIFQWIENVIVLCYGNTTAPDPSAIGGDSNYDIAKPLFKLSSSDNANWVYDSTSLFTQRRVSPGDEGVDRLGTGGWTPAKWGDTGRGGGYSEFYHLDGDTHTVPAMGMLINTSLDRYPTAGQDVAHIAWDFFRGCGINTVSMSGEKYRQGSRWPRDAALWRLSDGRTQWIQIWAEASPGSESTWTSLATHNNDACAGNKLLRLQFLGANEGGGKPVYLEIQTCTINFVTANLPTGNLLGQKINGQLDLTLSNSANDDAIVLLSPMLTGLTLVLDAEEKSILYDSVPAHDAMILNDHSRAWWLRLIPGTNTLTISTDDAGSLTVDLTWYRRRF